MFKARGVVLGCMMALALGLTAGCKLYETDRANKLVDAANAAIKGANDSSEKSGPRLQAMENAVPEIEDDEALTRWRTEARAIIADLEKVRDGYTEAGDKFEEASRLKLQDKFKEYLEYKSKEMKKRGEIASALIAKPQALIDSDGPDEYQKKAAAVITRLQDLEKEADDFEAQADKIYEENKALFKQS